MVAAGIKTMPKGGFGNRVLNYLNVRHIAAELGVPYFNKNSLDKSRIAGISRPWFGRYIPGKKLTITREMVQGDDFFVFAREQINLRHTLVFKPRLLDDTFAKVAKKDSRIFTKNLMTQCEAHRAERKSDEVQVVLHLRGTDFEDWNPRAILGSDYYIDALESILDESARPVSVRVCTDDLSHPALEGVSTFLDSLGKVMPRVNCANPFECDFSAMAEAEILVASPSTFALVAALLGRPKVIHNREWVTKCAEDGEYFWQRLLEDKIVGLNLRGFI